MKLRIAQLAPLWVEVPPRRYGGTERVVHTLTEELVARGHDVTLFAAEGSTTSADLRTCSPGPLWQHQDVDADTAQSLEIDRAVRESSRFDIIHSHLDGLPWVVAERFRAPLITTLHGDLGLVQQRSLLAAHQDQPLVSISDAQRRPVSDLRLNWIATVHHGIDLHDIDPTGGGRGDYLAFVGRFSPEKDPVTAIRVAIRAGIPLKLAARVDPREERYFHEEVEPHLSHPLVEWLGEIDNVAKIKLLSGARALLMPVSWEEPFGLSFVEALACGTPVIARPRGSLPEILVHGVHGFLVETEDQLVAAVAHVGSIDRATCRRWALQEFSPERMADGYEDAYMRVIEQHRVMRTSTSAVALHVG